MDNQGSFVEALGKPGHVQLEKNAWFHHFESERNVYILVFHEMLRSADYHDDDYKKSEALQPYLDH